MNEETKKMLHIFLLFNFSLLFLVGAFIFLDKRDFFDSFIICLPSQVFGFYCPFCGCSRSFYSLLRGDILSAFRYNAVFPFFFVYFILKELQALYAIIKNEPSRFNMRGLKAFFILFVLLFAVRNALLIFGIDITGDFLK